MTSAIILAAGQGTRLRPLTDELPKCLVPLLGKSLLERQIEVMNDAGVDRICVVTGFCADQIVRLGRALGYETRFNERYRDVNMVASLFCAEDFFDKGPGDLVVSYGDIVYERKTLLEILACDEDVSVIVDLGWQSLWGARQENPLDDAETLRMDENGHITELGKKPRGLSEIQGQFTGLVKIARRKIDDLKRFYGKLDRAKKYGGRTFDNMYMTDFLQLSIDANWKVKAVPIRHGWLEVDSSTDLKTYEELARRGDLDALCVLRRAR